MSEAKLIYGCGANSFYATGLEMHDPYAWYKDEKGSTHILLSALEVSRGRKNAKVDHVHAMSDAAQDLKNQGTPISTETLIAWMMEKSGSLPQVVEVPSDFPAWLFDELKAMGFNIKPVKGFFFPNRAVKRSDEIAKIRETQKMNAEAMSRAFEVLKEAEIAADKVLKWKGEVLTSEALRGVMNAYLAQRGAISFGGGPIIACGIQGADPHERGHGPLKADELIIIDTFPTGENFYNGDLSRTVLKGEPSEWQQNVFDAVKKSQELAISKIKAGVTGQVIHQMVEESLQNDGFETGTDENGDPFGFFHGTGHAVGLEVHDEGLGISPRCMAPLEENMVVTVEPGLYYPGKGGVRIEDIVAVTKDGVDNLTNLPKELVI